MAQEGFKRKLTAILSTDAVGYSRLMREDEESTVRDIAAHRVLISEIIQKHHGRVIDSPGDNILAEFASVVDAVNGAIKIQEAIRKSNAATPKERRMEFRIGINLGDVIEEEERIYGDGVNIAARVEGLAAAGGISISGTVYEHIKDKLSLGYHYSGEQDVKNIPEPVRVYRLLTEPEDAGKMIGEKKLKSRKSRYFAFGAIGLIILVVGIFFLWNNYFGTKIEPASVEKMAYPLPDKPSIAVLPFDNLSGDPEQEYFSDGLAEEIITAFSKVPGIYVIARNSSFTYKDKPTKVQQIAEELNIRYILEGSVRKDDDKVRITAQLIDALSGHHLWADRYDRKLKDLFAIQDEITMKILNAMEVNLTHGEQAHLLKKGTNDLQAYLKLLQGLHYDSSINPENNLKARQIYEAVISQDPSYALAYTELAVTHVYDVWFGTTKSPKASFGKAADLAQKALSIDPAQGVAYSTLGYIHIMRRKWDEGLELLYKGIELEPNRAESQFHLGLGLNFAGEPAKAMPVIKKALRLNPIPPSHYLNQMAIAYRMVGKYDNAIEYLEKCTRRYPNHLFSHLNLSACYILAGREQEAKDQAKEVLRIKANFSIDKFEKALPLKNQDEKQRFIGALRKAFSAQSDL